MAKKRRIMHKFRMDEIASVDRAAQRPAAALLMKRDDEDVQKRVVLTTDENGHTHSIMDFENSGTTSFDPSVDADFGHAHPWVRNDDGSLTIGSADGHTHEVREDAGLSKQAQLPEGQRSQRSADSGGGQHEGENPMTKVDDDKTAGAENEAVTKRLEELEKRAEKAESLAKLNDAEKAHWESLPDEGEDAFLKLDASGRRSELEKAQGDDPVVYTTDDGDVIRKSEGKRAENQARKIDEQARELAVEKAARRQETFEKRAEDELGNLPGERPLKVSLLKAIATMPDEEQKGVGELLAAANSRLAKAFIEGGTREGEPVVGKSDAEVELETRAQKRATDNDMTFAKAYKEEIESPEGRRLYKESRKG